MPFPGSEEDCFALIMCQVERLLEHLGVILKGTMPCLGNEQRFPELRVYPVCHDARLIRPMIALQAPGGPLTLKRAALIGPIVVNAAPTLFALLGLLEMGARGALGFLQRRDS